MGVIALDTDLLEYSQHKEPGRILVISGWRGAGKSRFCKQAVDQFRAAGLKVGGVLSPARFENGEKTGIIFQDLNSGQVRLAASTREGEVHGFRLGPYYFDREVVEWANALIRHFQASDLLVIDELGYLEFDSQAGIFSSFEKLRQKEFQLALVVIRPERVAAFGEMGFVFDQINIGSVSLK